MVLMVVALVFFSTKKKDDKVATKLGAMDSETTVLIQVH